MKSGLKGRNYDIIGYRNTSISNSHLFYTLLNIPTYSIWTKRLNRFSNICKIINFEVKEGFSYHSSG